MIDTDDNSPAFCDVIFTGCQPGLVGMRLSLVNVMEFMVNYGDFQCVMMM